jgi:hypothetical protein
MKTIIKAIFLSGFLLITAFSCKKDEKPSFDPDKAILGKWEIIEMGNWPNMEPVTEPTGYKEYLSDSILQEYEYKTGNIYIKKYWIDSLLHVGIDREDGFQLVFEYKYEFFDNKLRLDVTNFMMLYNTSIYKRIK